MSKLEICTYSNKADGATKLSANFSVREFSCNDDSDPVLVAPALVEVLQKIRTNFGRAVTINSAYRTPTYNKEVGGATYSVHQYGGAAVIAMSGVTA